MSHGGGFGAFPAVKRGPKRRQYVYAKRQGCYNIEPGIVTNMGETELALMLPYRKLMSALIATLL